MQCDISKGKKVNTDWLSLAHTVIQCYSSLRGLQLEIADNSILSAQLTRYQNVSVSDL